MYLTTNEYINMVSQVLNTHSIQLTESSECTVSQTMKRTVRLHDYSKQFVLCIFLWCIICCTLIKFRQTIKKDPDNWSWTEIVKLPYLSLWLRQNC